MPSRRFVSAGAGLAIERKRRPEVGVGVGLPEFEHGLLHGPYLITRAIQVAVKEPQKLAGAGPWHVPNAREDGLRAGVEQAPEHTCKLLPVASRIQAWATAAQADQFAWQTEVVEGKQAQLRIPKSQRGKQRVVAAEHGPSGKMDVTAPGALLSKGSFARRFTYQHLRVLGRGGNGLRLLDGLLRMPIGNRQHQGAVLHRLLLGAAQVVETGAAGIGDRKLLHQEPLAVVQRREGQVLQEAVRRDDQVTRVKLSAERREELIIQLLKRQQGGLAHGLSELAQMISS